MKLYINENNKVVTMHEATSDMKCFEEFENRKPYSFDGVKELENLKICLIDYYKDIGVIFKEVEGQSYVDVKFSKYGHQA